MIHRPPAPAGSLFAAAAPVKQRRRMPTVAAIREAMAPADPNVRAEDRPRLTGQNAKVLSRLREGPLTVTEAWEQMRIRRLGARVWDLKQAGCSILTTPLAGGETLYTLIATPKETGRE